MDTHNMESLVEEEDDSSTSAARRVLVVGDTGEGIYKLLLVFNIFKPNLQWAKPSTCHADLG